MSVIRASPCADLFFEVLPGVEVLLCMGPVSYGGTFRFPGFWHHKQGYHQEHFVLVISSCARVSDAYTPRKASAGLEVICTGHFHTYRHIVLPHPRGHQPALSPPPPPPHIDVSQSGSLSISHVEKCILGLGISCIYFIWRRRLSTLSYFK